MTSGLGAAPRIVRPPVMMAARVGPIMAAPGYIAASAIHAAVPAAVRSGPVMAAPGYISARPTGGVPWALNPHRQPSFVTEIGPGSAGTALPMPRRGQRPPSQKRSLRRAQRRLRKGLHGLGALTPEQATEQVFPAARVSSSAGHNQAIRDGILAAIRAGQMLNVSGQPAYLPGTADCSATGQSSNVKLAQVSGQMALTGLNTAAMASASVMASVGGAAVLGAATLGIGALIGLFPLLFGHHAKAVAKEQSVLCSAVPAANNYLQIIDQGVSSGQVSPQQGIDALNSLLADFGSQVASIRKGADPTSSGECNAACVMVTVLKAIVAYRASAYQDLAAQQAAGPAGAISSAVSQLGLPAWAIPAAIFGLLWMAA